MCRKKKVVSHCRIPILFTPPRSQGRPLGSHPVGEKNFIADTFPRKTGLQTIQPTAPPTPHASSQAHPPLYRLCEPNKTIPLYRLCERSEAISSIENRNQSPKTTFTPFRSRPEIATACGLAMTEQGRLHHQTKYRPSQDLHQRHPIPSLRTQQNNSPLPSLRAQRSNLLQ